MVDDKASQGGLGSQFDITPVRNYRHLNYDIGKWEERREKYK